MGLAVGEVIAITGCRSDQTSADCHNVHDSWAVQNPGTWCRAPGGSSNDLKSYKFSNFGAKNMWMFYFFASFEFESGSEGKNVKVNSPN